MPKDCSSSVRCRQSVGNVAQGSSDLLPQKLESVPSADKYHFPEFSESVKKEKISRSSFKQASVYFFFVARVRSTTGGYVFMCVNKGYSSPVTVPVPSPKGYLLVRRSTIALIVENLANWPTRQSSCVNARGIPPAA